MDSNSDSYSLSVPQSIRSETKEKFDALLKNALKKTLDGKETDIQKGRNVYEQDSTTASSENLLDKDELHHDNNDRQDNFILNKFLTDTQTNNIEYFIKPPVPKPRKKPRKVVKEDSLSSHATFEITSPKVLKALSPSKRSNSSYSNQTYVKSEKAEYQIGDVIIHDSPKISKISVVSSRSSSSIREKADLEVCEKNIHSDNHENANPTDSNTVYSEKNKSDETSIRSARESDTTEKKITKNENEDVKKCSYDKITEIIVHKTDKLLIKSFLIHPVVKIHIVDIKTGKYFLKSDRMRSVIFYYENQDTDYILPVMTHYYNLQEKRTLYPSWEENITINEDFEYLATTHVIYFFEVLDFLTITAKQNQKLHKASFKGWHRICFAFLKPIGKNNAKNLNKKLRLQLYYSNNNVKDSSEECYLWKLWNTKKLRKYPSTLYITIKSIIAPDKVIKTMRSKTPLQQEKSSIDIFKEDFVFHENEKEEATNIEEKILSDFTKSWMRSSNTFEIPNKCIAKLDSFGEGSFVHKFSNNGLYLACAVKISEMFTVIVYSVETFEEIKKYACHQGLIYSITWSKNDWYIITCSADNTIAVWDYKKDTFLQILPHPSFVYTSDINNKNVIASGCFDGCIRIWVQTVKAETYDLYQELTKHDGFVTSLCFDKLATSLYSSDSTGQIFMWEEVDSDWTFKMQLKILDLKNVTINQIILFPNEKKLLVHSRDSTLRIISLKSQCILHWLQGCLNERTQIVSSISHCGNYVMSGSENGLVTIWNAKTGECEKTYSPFTESKLNVTAHCVQFHPRHSIVSFSSHGADFPIVIYVYEESTEKAADSLADTHKDRSKFTLPRKTTGEYENRFDFKGILQKIDEILQ